MSRIDTTSQAWINLREEIRRREGANDQYAATLASNGNWHYGLYQFNLQNLRTLGYYDGTDASLQAFLQNRDAQNEAADRFAQLLWTELQTRRTTDFVNRYIGDVLITESGLMAASWLCRISTLDGYIRQAVNDSTTPPPGDGQANVLQRLNNFQNYDNPTTNQPPAWTPPFDIQIPNINLNDLRVLPSPLSRAPSGCSGPVC